MLSRVFVDLGGEMRPELASMIASRSDVVLVVAGAANCYAGAADAGLDEKRGWRRRVRVLVIS